MNKNSGTFRLFPKISVTNSNNCRPVLDFIDGLPDSAWTAIRSDRTEEAIISHHQPDKWQREQTYVVTRSWHDGRQWLVEPGYSVMLVSRSDLPLKELARRHREKQRQENAQKGPLTDLDLHHPPYRKSTKAPRQPGILCLRPNCPDAAESTAIQDAAEKRTKTWSPAINPETCTICRSADLQWQEVDAEICENNSRSGLVVGDFLSAGR